LFLWITYKQRGYYTMTNNNNNTANIDEWQQHQQSPGNEHRGKGWEEGGGKRTERMGWEEESKEWQQWGGYNLMLKLSEMSNWCCCGEQNWIEMLEGMGEGTWGGLRGSVKERQEAESKGMGKFYFFTSNIKSDFTCGSEHRNITNPPSSIFPSGFLLFRRHFLTQTSLLIAIFCQCTGTEKMGPK
jgi:hypothetical protein